MLATMGPDARFVTLLLSFLCAVFPTVEAGDYCGKLGDKEFYCEKGHCCGEFKCCGYYRYYEMWWFWLLWCVVIVLGCTCAYYRRHNFGYFHLSNYLYPAIQIERIVRVDHPADQECKLPSYEEVIAMPQLGPPASSEGAPPPYSGFTGSELNNGEQNYNPEEVLLFRNSLEESCPTE